LTPLSKKCPQSRQYPQCPGAQSCQPHRAALDVCGAVSALLAMIGNVRWAGVYAIGVFHFLFLFDKSGSVEIRILGCALPPAFYPVFSPRSMVRLLSRLVLTKISLGLLFALKLEPERFVNPLRQCQRERPRLFVNLNAFAIACSIQRPAAPTTPDQWANTAPLHRQNSAENTSHL
jgi:hypothetical protein